MKKSELLAQYPYKIELHAHSYPCSGCSDNSPAEVVRLCKEKGYDAIVMTNHFYQNASKEHVVNAQLMDYTEAVEAGNIHGVKVLLGAEIRFKENSNDYLLIGTDEALLYRVFDHLGGTLADLRRDLSLPESLLIQAHPFRPHCIASDPKLIDGIEVFNLHPHHNSYNHLAQAYACENPQLIVTAGSDFHHNQPGHCGTTALRTAVLPEDSFELARILRSGDYLLQLHDSVYIP